MSTKYWIRKGTQVEGPFDQLQIRGLVALMRLTPEMEISADGQHWRAAGLVKGLFPEEGSSNSFERAEGSPHVTTPATVPVVEPLRVGWSKRLNLKRRVIVAVVIASVGGIGTYLALNADGGSGCGDGQVVNLTTSIIYEQMGKHALDLRNKAAQGFPVSDSDVLNAENRFRKAVKLSLSAISTTGQDSNVTRCRAVLHVKTTGAVDPSETLYWGPSYNDGADLSYSVRESDDGKNIVVRIPAE